MLIRSLYILLALGSALIVASVGLLSGSQLSTLTNWFLPTDWEISTPKGGINAGLQNADLAQITVSYQNCPLLSAENIAVHWQPKQKFSIEKATLDYQCLLKLPSDSDSNSTSEFLLTPWLALLPEGEAEIQSLHWQNLPTDLSPRLTQLLEAPTAVKLAFFQQKLTASVQQQAVDFNAKFANQTLSGNVRYEPNAQEKHNLLFSAKLNENLALLPHEFDADYHWVLPQTQLENEILREGSSRLTWHTDVQNLVGNWSFNAENAPKNQFNLPFKFNGKTLEIQQGQFYWDWLESFPLQGFVNASFTPKSFVQGEYFPIKTALRFSLLSQSPKSGKGNIVLQNVAGELQKDSLNLPLQVTGNVKYGDFILYSSLPVFFSGKFDDLKFKFQPKSLLRLVGKQRFLNIKELRFPLAGIQIDKYGVNGRLQAIFKGESPDFKNIALHLDGFARNFKIGQTDFFEDPSDKNQLQDQWHWKVWGNTDVKSLRTPLQLSGRGNWRDTQVKITEFTGQLGKIKRSGVYIPKMNLNLLEEITFAYQKWHLEGGVNITAPQILFDYGGKIHQPNATLYANGEIENLNLRGEIQAGKIGPLKLFARRKVHQNASELIGRLYWKEQPANIFQSLLPLRQDWLITGGTIRGETAFSVSVDKGFTAGGHFAIRNGSLSLPNGGIQGIEFSFPYRLQNDKVDFGLKQPIDLYIAKLTMGLPITNIRAKVFGRFPYSQNHPLVLKQLSMNLLDGALNVEHFALPQTQIAYLKLKDINFERILELTQYQQIELKGKADATLPFWLEGHKCYVCDGLLTQSSESNLKILPELMKAISQSSGYSERLLLYLLNDTKITDLRSLINVGPQGEMVLDAKLKMQLNQQEKAKINFNYNHKENIFSLWHLINSGSYMEQSIENSIYQKLDKRR